MRVSLALVAVIGWCTAQPATRLATLNAIGSCFPAHSNQIKGAIAGVASTMGRFGEPISSLLIASTGGPDSGATHLVGLIASRMGGSVEIDMKRDVDGHGVASAAKLREIASASAFPAEPRVVVVTGIDDVSKDHVSRLNLLLRALDRTQAAEMVPRNGALFLLPVELSEYEERLLDQMLVSGARGRADASIQERTAAIKRLLTLRWQGLQAQEQAPAGPTSGAAGAQPRALTPEAVLGRIDHVVLMRPAHASGKSRVLDWQDRARRNERCSTAPSGPEHAGLDVIALATDPWVLVTVAGSVTAAVALCYVVKRKAGPGYGLAGVASAGASNTGGTGRHQHRRTDRAGRAAAAAAGSSLAASGRGGERHSSSDDDPSGSDSGSETESGSQSSDDQSETPAAPQGPRLRHTAGGGTAGNRGSGNTLVSGPQRSAANLDGGAAESRSRARAASKTNRIRGTGL
jgi:hypothetical protein